MESTTKPPSEFRRALWVYAAMAGFIALSGPTSLLYPEWWQQQPPSEILKLLLPALAGVAFGLLFSRDIWNLVVRRNPMWKDLLAGVLAIAAPVALIYLRESGIWLWSFASGDALAFSFLATMALVTVLTERRSQVRIYASTRNFTFVQKQRAA
jgi:hypothetical protein